MAVRGSPNMRRQSSFWTQPRPIRTSHAECRPRTRSRSMTFVDTWKTAGVTHEVENFRIYGDLRKTETEVRNTLPTASTIETEKTLLWFEKQRKLTPCDADYSQFYRCLSASVVSNAGSHVDDQQSLPSASGKTRGEDHQTTAPAVASGQYLQSVPADLRK